GPPRGRCLPRIGACWVSFLCGCECGADPSPPETGRKIECLPVSNRFFRGSRTMPALNYKHLRYFWTVARLGSAARAAEALHLSAHAISGQLRQFEAALGVQLIERRGRRLVLTNTGHRLLEYADDIFALGDEALDMLRRPDARQAR